jgi:hypothetical protein
LADATAHALEARELSKGAAGCTRCGGLGRYRLFITAWSTVMTGTFLSPITTKRQLEPPRPRYVARLIGAISRYLRTKRGINATLAYEAVVTPAAPPILDLPPTERHDNLVLASGWDDDVITVKIGSFNNPPEGLPWLVGYETIHLVIGSYAFDPIQLSLEDPDDPFSAIVPDVAEFHVARALLGEPADYRRYEMFYEIHYAGGTDRGPAQLLSVDNVPPANTSFVGQLAFDDDRILKNGITPDVFIREAGNEYIRARIPSYAGQKAGDVIRGYINGEEDPSDEDIGRVDWGNTGVVTVLFSREFIESVGDGLWKFQYRIYSREDLQSNLSEPVEVRVLLEEFIADLGAPAIPAYDDDDDPKRIDEQDARSALVIRIPPHARVTVEHSLRIVWGSLTTTLVAVEDPSNIGVIMPYNGILADWLAKNPGADDVEVPVDVKYEIFKGDLQVGTSPAHRIMVNLHVAGGGDPDPGSEPNENLLSPVVRPASGAANDDRIPIADSIRDASVRIPKKGENGEGVFKVLDRVTVHYAGRTLTPRTVETADLEDLDEPLVIVLPRADIIAGGAGMKQVSYWTERDLAAGGSNTSKSPVKDVLVHTSEALPGKGILEKAILPEIVGTAIGLDALRDGTPVAIPEYEIFDSADTIVIFAAMYLGPRPQPDEMPVPGFGAEDTDDDQFNRFEVPVPLVIRPAETGEVAEPGAPGARPTRPPVTEPHILFRIPRDRFPDVDANLTNVYHVFLRYEITNEVGATVSDVLTFLVDPRGAPPTEEGGEPASTNRMVEVASRMRSLMGTLRDLLAAMDRLLR